MPAKLVHQPVNTAASFAVARGWIARIDVRVGDHGDGLVDVVENHHAIVQGKREIGQAPVTGPAPTVTFDDDASTNATVIDVRAPDAIGVLYRITRALTELDLDIRSAKVQTVGHHVVDAFYVRDGCGHKITDRHTLGELERAILHSLAGTTTA